MFSVFSDTEFKAVKSIPALRKGVSLYYDLRPQSKNRSMDKAVSKRRTTVKRFGRWSKFILVHKIIAKINGLRSR